MLGIGANFAMSRNMLVLLHWVVMPFFAACSRTSALNSTKDWNTFALQALGSSAPVFCPHAPVLHTVPCCFMARKCSQRARLRRSWVRGKSNYFSFPGRTDETFNRRVRLGNQVGDKGAVRPGTRTRTRNPMFAIVRHALAAKGFEKNRREAV